MGIRGAVVCLQMSMCQNLDCQCDNVKKVVGPLRNRTSGISLVIGELPSECINSQTLSLALAFCPPV